MDDEEFYKAVNRLHFDAGVKCLSADVLGNLLKLILASGIGVGPFRNTKGTLTYALKKLVEQMLFEVKDTFKDIDDYIASGKLPPYMNDTDAKEFAAKALRDVIKRMQEEERRRR